MLASYLSICFHFQTLNYFLSQEHLKSFRYTRVQAYDSATINQSSIIYISFFKLSTFLHSTGGPPFTRFSLPQIPLLQFLADICTSGNFCIISRGSPTVPLMRGPSVLNFKLFSCPVKEVYMIEISSYCHMLVRRCYRKILNGLGCSLFAATHFVFQLTDCSIPMGMQFQCCLL